MLHKKIRFFFERPTLLSKEPSRFFESRMHEVHPKGLSLTQIKRLGYGEEEGRSEKRFRIPDFSQICVQLNGGDTHLP